MISEQVQLALVAILLALVNGGAVVWIGHRVKSSAGKQDSDITSLASAQQELAKVRQEYREQIAELRTELKTMRADVEARDRRIDHLEETVARLTAENVELRRRAGRTEREGRA